MKKKYCAPQVCVLYCGDAFIMAGSELNVRRNGDDSDYIIENAFSDGETNTADAKSHNHLLWDDYE